MRMLLLALLVAAPAYADKPTLAVLGVIPKDHSLVASTNTLNTTLRTRAAAKASPYRVQGTKKAIDAAILAAECSTVEVTCAAKLGATLGAEWTLAGELEKRGTSVELTLTIVDVASKKKLRSVRQKLAGKADMAKLARTAFDRVTGAVDFSELALTANAQRGDIYLNGELVGALFEGHATITHLVPGAYKLEVRANGYRPFSIEIDVEGPTAKQNVLLEPAS